jgi:hypothetical protein
MVTFAQLRDARLEPMAQAVTAWTRLARQLETAEDAYRYKLLKPLGDSRWQGRDSAAAYAKLLPVTQQIRVSATEASAIASVLHSGHGRFKAAQDKLKHAIAAAEGMHLKVGDDGSLTPPERLPQGYLDLDHYRLEMGKIHSRFQAVVNEATQADGQISETLAQLDAGVLNSRDPLVGAARDAGLATRLAGFDPGAIPPPGVRTAEQVAGWWKGLPEEQRHLMMNAFPGKIGWLNGIPSEDRDEANRTRLANRLSHLQSKPPAELTAFEQRDLKRLTEFQQKLSMYEGKGYDVYILGLDSETPGHKDELARRESRMGPRWTDGPDGRAIVAFGNPDTAQHTAIKVPGTGTDLDAFRRDLRHVSNLYDASAALNRGSVSTIAWFDYDAPDLYSDAAFDSYYEQGVPRLSGFVDGVNANQTMEQGARQHTTLIGHSYGSTLVGA